MFWWLVLITFEESINKKSRTMTNEQGNTVMALLAGAAIGAGIGMLFAPASGEETRERIKKKAGEVSDNVSESTAKMKHDIIEKASNKKAAIGETLDELVSAMSYKADDVITALEKKLAELKEKNAQLQK
jgi:gas vesicle protein